MLKILLTSDQSKKSKILCVPCFENLKVDDVKGVDKDIASKQLKDLGFTGKQGTFQGLNLQGQYVLFYGLGKQDDLKYYDVREIGAQLYANLLKYKSTDIAVVTPNGKMTEQSAEFASELAFGMQLRSYSFRKYKTKQKETPFDIESAALVVSDADAVQKLMMEKEAIAHGMFMTRDLMHEPPNVLYPETFSDRVKELKNLGIKVTILDHKELESLGMNAILAVGMGSGHKPRLAIMEWSNGPSDEKPVAFVGKGVTFDTGGISLKPPAKMDEMKYDMTGAAVVTGLMKTLATRQAKVNVVGLIGLAENSPDGEAYRPGDIITTYSGQTIEVTNTDAEGRVVLSDVLSYAVRNYDPKCVIDLATLTGAIVIALGHEYAGLFSNNDELADNLKYAGDSLNEKLWRMPLCEAYDRLIDSKIADVNNAGPRQASSATAAHFLQRFIDDKPWAHIDIAGAAWGDKAHPLSGHVAYGYGVQLLNEYVKKNHE
jgi:leucyl aminopeptidase